MNKNFVKISDFGLAITHGLEKKEDSNQTELNETGNNNREVFTNVSKLKPYKASSINYIKN